MIKLAIASTALGGALLTGFFQPEWAAPPIPLTPGQEYRTGSPLSKPGLGGLFGSIFESTYGGQQFKGGGTVLYTGNGGFVDTTSYSGGPTQPPQVQEATCPHITVNGQTFCTYQSLDAAHSAQRGMVDALPTPSDPTLPVELGSENKPRAVVPICEASQRLAVFFVPDDELGTRMIYVCQ